MLFPFLTSVGGGDSDVSATASSPRTIKRQNSHHSMLDLEADDLDFGGPSSLENIVSIAQRELMSETMYDVYNSCDEDILFRGEGDVDTSDTNNTTPRKAKSRSKNIRYRPNFVLYKGEESFVENCIKTF